MILDAGHLQVRFASIEVGCLKSVRSHYDDAAVLVVGVTFDGVEQLAANAFAT